MAASIDRSIGDANSGAGDVKEFGTLTSLALMPDVFVRGHTSGCSRSSHRTAENSERGDLIPPTRWKDLYRGKTDTGYHTGFPRVFWSLEAHLDGTPNTTFNGRGFVAIPIWGWDDRAQSLAVQPDGKIVVAGHAWGPACDYTCEDRVAIVPLNSEGWLDRSFNGNGVIAIVMAGENSEALGETSFDRTDVVILTDGTIEIKMSPEPRDDSAYLRVHANGSLEGASTTSSGISSHGKRRSACRGHARPPNG